MRNGTRRFYQKVINNFNIFPLFCPQINGQPQEEKLAVSGLVIPRDNQGFNVRNGEGQFEIQWTPKTQVALEVNTRQFKNLRNGILHYRVHSSNQK